MSKKARSSQLYVLHSSGGELMIEGTAAALRDLAEILVISELVPRSLLLDPSVDPRPYDRALRQIAVELSKQPKVRFTRDGDTLKIQGGVADLCLLADNITVLVEGADPHQAVTPHLHLDYYPEHQLLRADSESVVVSCAA
jgi:hypothetical protein